jgi:hypothetical protein
MLVHAFRVRKRHLAVIPALIPGNLKLAGITSKTDEAV